MRVSDLPTVGHTRTGPLPKPDSRKRVKARKARAEKKVKDAVRAECVWRDGDCAVENAFFGGRGGFASIADVTTTLDGEIEGCRGDSQWAHMHDRRRSKTRGMAPEIRHDVKHSLMLCQRHHDQYDNKAQPRLFITALTRKGADGPLKFRRRTTR